MELVVLNTSGKETGRKVQLDDTIFGIEPNQHAVYLEVKQYLAAQRQGTHKSKERSEITASTKKLKKQKGSGSARYGDIKSPVFKGGGRVFGPKPRDYRFKLNKALKRLAKKSVRLTRLNTQLGEEVVVLAHLSVSPSRGDELARRGVRRSLCIKGLLEDNHGRRLIDDLPKARLRSTGFVKLPMGRHGGQALVHQANTRRRDEPGQLARPPTGVLG